MSICFISYSTKDQKFVEEELLEIIKTSKLEPWFAPQKIDAADLWEKAIEEGIERTGWFILVMSPASAVSDHVRKELAIAMKSHKGCIIPVKIQDCNASEFHIELPKINFIDFQDNTKKPGLKLISTLLGDQCHTTSRKRTILGKWTGNVHENPGPKYTKGLVFPVEAIIQVKGRDISGEISIDLNIENRRERHVFDLTGLFYYDKFLQINYSAKDTGAIQFGSIIAALNDKGDLMEGNYVAYSAHQEGIVTGSVTMEKSQNLSIE